MDLTNLPKFALKINPEDETTGVDFISFVESPAIEVDFVTLSEEKKQEFKILSKEKQFLSGPALIPNKLIYREYDGMPYVVYFDEKTIEDIVKKFFRNNNIFNTNENHSEELSGNYIIESWIIDEPKKDKSRTLGFKGLPKGTWMVTYHVPNKEYWEEKVLTEEVKGFSIEGIFQHIEETDEFKSQILSIHEEEMESFSDYPKAASENAARAIKYRDENNIDCGTRVGWARANQLASGEPISEETIKRMASFNRHRQNKDVPYDEGCGGIMWDAWGGDEGIDWAIRKSQQIDENKIEMKKEERNILTQLANLLRGVKAEEVESKEPVVEDTATEEQKFMDYESADGTKLWVEEETNQLFIVTVNEETGEEERVPFTDDAMIELNDGRLLIVEDGVVIDIAEKTDEEPAEEEMEMQEFASGESIFVVNTSTNEVFTKTVTDEGEELVKFEESGEFELEDGRILVIEEGMFKEFKNAEVEASEEEVETEEALSEETDEEEKVDMTAELLSAVTELKEQIAKMQERLNKISKEPSGEEIKTNSYVMNPEEKLKRQKNRRELMLDLTNQLKSRK